MPKRGNYEWTKLTISSQAKSNNGKYEILEKYSRDIASGKTYKYVFKCIKCGHIFEGTKHSVKCPNCLHKEHYNQYIGFKNDRYEIIELDHIEPINKNPRFKVKCLKCGDISIKSWGTIINKTKGKYLGCSKCRKGEGNGKIPSLESPIKAYYR